MFRVRHIAFSLAIVGVAASLPTDLAHARGQALKRHPFRIIGEKACAVVRMVDEDPEGRRARDEPRAQLGPLGQPVRPAGRRSDGLASPCRPDYRANCERRVDRALGQ
jgi:hypothetical protein